MKNVFNGVNCRYVLADMEIAYRLLVPSVEALCQVNPLEGVSYNENEAEAVVLFSLKALADIGECSTNSERYMSLDESAT